MCMSECVRSISIKILRILIITRRKTGKEEQNIQFEIKTHGPKRDSGPISLIVNACASRDLSENVVGVCFVAQDITGQKTIMDKFTRIEGDYKAIVQNPNPLIPPIFGTDEFGWCSEWNQAMTELSGWCREDVIDKMLMGEVFGTHTACCRLKNQEDFVSLGIVLNNAMTGRDSEKLASHELQQAIHIQRLSEQTAAKRLKALAYIRRQIKNPLSGIVFSRKMMEGTELGDEQKRLLHTSAQCQRQLNKVLDDTDLDCIIDGYMDMEMMEFTLHEVLVASISQVMIKSTGKGIQIVNDIEEDIMTETLYGDSVRLQQVLADFLVICVNFTPNGGHLGLAASLTKDDLGQSVQLVHLEFRITHAGGGVPEELLSQMFGSNADASEEGISLHVSRKLVKLMNGDVQYLREAGKSTFIISVELAAANKP
ncbi:hypothetical protein RJ639_038908 [Escallonia herrerae]|uniref:Phytochrome n=1 Tax=Escallonia herrerae TaxID=1293975 RepID=A0AA88X103_9ASTE|nr:hypothetical protein RJ639_038908 [Escallonia herrerae]